MRSLQGSIFIDPENSGSSVGYYIHINEYKTKDKKIEYNTSATVVLSDCSHKIDWTFETDDVAKIDAAIRILREFRKRYIETEKMVADLNK